MLYAIAAHNVKKRIGVNTGYCKEEKLLASDAIKYIYSRSLFDVAVSAFDAGKPTIVVAQMCIRYDQLAEIIKYDPQDKRLIPIVCNAVHVPQFDNSRPFIGNLKDTVFGIDEDVYTNGNVMKVAFIVFFSGLACSIDASYNYITRSHTDKSIFYMNKSPVPIDGIKEEIFKSHELVQLGISVKHVQHRCLMCGDKVNYGCAKCKSGSYCGYKCAQDHVNEHKADCELLVKYKDGVMDDLQLSYLNKFAAHKTLEFGSACAVVAILDLTREEYNELKVSDPGNMHLYPKRYAFYDAYEVCRTYGIKGNIMHNANKIRTLSVIFWKGALSTAKIATYDTYNISSSLPKDVKVYEIDKPGNIVA